MGPKGLTAATWWVCSRFALSEERICSSASPLGGSEGSVSLSVYVQKGCQVLVWSDLVSKVVWHRLAFLIRGVTLRRVVLGNGASLFGA